jgi:hypothetical protein
MPKPFLVQPSDDDDPPELKGSGPPAQRPGPKPHVPTETDRATVRAMVAGGIEIADIAKARGLSKVTLYRRYRDEIENGATILNGRVVQAWLKKIEEGDFAAIKWWLQTRMGYSEKVTVDNLSADKPLRVIVEFVGGQPPQAQPAVPVIEAKPVQPASRLPGTVVEFKGGRE